MDNTKIDKLKALLELSQNDTITPKEVEKFLVTILSVIKQSKDSFEKLSSENLKQIDLILTQIKKNYENSINTLDSKSNAVVEQIEAKLAIVNDTLANVKKIKATKGKDGYTPQKGVDYFDGIDGKNGQDGSPDTAEQIANKLETLKDEARLDASAIKNLPKFIEQSPVPNGGGWRNLFQLHDVSIPTPTNGQALIYNSTTEQWEAGSAGSSSPLTTKGDLYTYTTTNARLPVGTNGQVLSANSATTTGLEWIAAPTGLTLQTNGTPNGDQTLLNLIQGTGINIVDNGAGGITISSSGGSGTVTSFSFTDGNGFTGLVTNSTTTPTLALTLQDANTSQSGQLTSTDWNTFNNKVSSQWVTSGSDIYYDTGNVGIGNTSPTTKLDVTGVLTLSGATAQIVTNTTDGSDNQELAFSAANALGVDRGAFFALEGNEVATIGGSILFGAGNVSTGNIDFYTGNYINRMRVANGGQVSIGSTSTSSKFNVYSATGAIQRLETGTSTLDLEMITTVGAGYVGINSDAMYIQAYDSLSGGIIFWPNTAGNQLLHLLANGSIQHAYNSNNYLTTTIASTGAVDFSITSNNGTPTFTFNESLILADAKNIIFGTTTGTKIGTATSEKIGFWNTTPIVQPTTAITAGTFVANTSLIFDDSATFDGYTMGQVVAALRAAGLLA